MANDALFWAKVDRSGGPEACWLWTAGLTRFGYGKVKRDGHTMNAMRASWAINVGPIPPGMEVCHRCDNPPCVNPAHLWLGTKRENQLDKVAKGRQATGDRHGRRLHPETAPFGDRNGRRTHPEAWAKPREVARP